MAEVKKRSGPSITQVIDAVYDDKALSLSEANEIEVSDAKKVNSISGGNKAMNYGEMTLDSWSEALKQIGAFDQDDVFFDLGCGRGTLVVQAALEYRYPGMKCVGVELSRKRYSMAAAAANRLSRIRQKPKCPEFVKQSEVSFLQEDMRQTNLENATLVYLMNQDLPIKLVEDVVVNLVSIAKNRQEESTTTSENMPVFSDSKGSGRSKEEDTSAEDPFSSQTIETSPIPESAHETSTVATRVDSEDGSSTLPPRTVDVSPSPKKARKRLLLLTLLRLRGAPSQPIKVLSCRQTWVAGGNKNVDLFVYDLCKS